MTTCTHNGTANGTCPICRFEPFARNHYFDGKFMVARDFTDEQRYYVDKQRHHNARLHGWGVVCGLKVKPHENPACRSKYICIEPGTAIDCCGREIVISEEDCIDITQLAGWKALKKLVESEPEPKLMRLQICLKYRECPTEDVPVLYDECGCDETKCAPNRILESHDIDLRVVPMTETQEFHDPKVEWHCSAGPSHAFRVALHSDSNRLYAIARDKNAVLVLDTTNHTVVGVYALNQLPTDLALSNDGKHLYVAIKGASETDPHQLVVWDTQTGTQVSIDAIPGSVGDTVELAVVPSPDNRLCVLLDTKGDVFIWPLSLETATTQPSPLSPPPNLAHDIHGLTFNKNAQVAYSAKQSDNTVRVLKLASNPTSGTPITIPSPPPYAPSDLAFVARTGPDALVGISSTTNELLFIDLPGNQFKRSNALAHPAKDVVVAPGGRWAYVLEQDTSGESYVQALNLDRVQLQLTPNVSLPFKVGQWSQQLVLDASGGRLYIPFQGDLKVDSSGGIAVLKVMEGSCEEIPWRSLEGCPHCETPDCIVIATIKDYKIGEAIEVRQIDNRTRHLLPSTQTLYEMIKCLKEHGGNGKDGQDGVNWMDGVGLEPGLTRIIATSWVHNTTGQSIDERIQQMFTDKGMPILGGIVPINNFNNALHSDRRAFQIFDKTWGFAILFSGEIKVYDLPIPSPPISPTLLIDSYHIFQLELRHQLLFNNPVFKILGPKLGIPGLIVPIDWSTDPSGNVDWLSLEESTGPNAKGIAMIITQDIQAPLFLLANVSDITINLHGDFVLDTRDRAIDAEFVRARFRTGDRPATAPGNQYGIQGGLFESWFRMSAPQSPGGGNPVNVRSADIMRIGMVSGMTLPVADKILTAFHDTPFKSEKDFRNRVSLTAAEWNAIRNQIRFDNLEG